MGSVTEADELTAGGTDSTRRSNKGKNQVSLWKLARISTVAAGVQFGWALQLSLLTPYVEELGIPHAWASYIWLCGPISGMLMQPVVGHMSDHCESSWGRRRPFVVGGALCVVVATIVIGFSADVGYALGDSLTSRPRAIVVFVLGFWILDLANNTLQGPCRALLADFTGKDHRRARMANAFFSLFMAVGNVLGYATGAYSGWYKILAFTVTDACGVSCANLKSAFLLSILLMALTTIMSVTAAPEIPRSSLTTSSRKRSTDPTLPLLSSKTSNDDSKLVGGRKQVEVQVKEDEDDQEEPEQEAFFWELVGSLRDQPKPMRYVLLVTALTWLAWFPFILFDTDWMGREVYLGEPSSTDATLTSLYDSGVSAGSFGLMLNSVVLGITSVCIEPVCRRFGQRKVWAAANVLMSACFVGTAIIGFVAESASDSGSGQPSAAILGSAFAIFAILGAPLAVTYSVPYAITANITYKAGGGQGLSMGVLNLAVVSPQIIVSVGAGPWDELFGGGNMPAFLVGAVSALTGGILAAILLPKTPNDHVTGSIQRIPTH